MADKTIGALPAIETMADDALFVAEQQGAAGRVSGAQIRGFAQDAVSTYVGQAQTAAEEAAAAQGSAETAASEAAASKSAAQAAAASAAEEAQAVEDLTVAANTLSPGASATVAKTKENGVYKLTFGLPQGEKGETGAAGSPGANGVSPTVAVTDIPGGHRVTITDAEGTESFDVLDGAGAGDMTSAVYDPQGKAQDIFAYVDGKTADAGDMKTSVYDAQGKAEDVFQYVDRKTANLREDMEGYVSEQVGAQNNVFVAQWDVTTSAELEAAYQAGKLVVVKHPTNGRTYVMFKREQEVLHGFYALDSTGSYGKKTVLEYCYCVQDNWVGPNAVSLIKSGSGAPSKGLPAAEGDLYVDTTYNLLYRCASVSTDSKGNINGTTWERLDPPPDCRSVTLSASGWDSTAKTQTVTVSGVVAAEGAMLILPCPASASIEAYREAGVRCTAQGTDTLTFTADTIPTTDLVVYVTMMAVTIKT